MLGVQRIARRPHVDWRRHTSAPRLAGPRCLLLILGCLLTLWLWLLLSLGQVSNGPNGSSFGTDFAMFYGAARVVAQGGNPYDSVQTYRAESAALQAEHAPITTLRYVHVANPPLFYWALGPLARLPFRTAAWLWVALMYALAALGFMAASRHTWPRRAYLHAVLFLAMPQTTLAMYYANVNGLILAALGGGTLLSRRRPAPAGAVLSLALIKPQIGLPAIGLVLLAHPGVRRRMVLGLLGALAVETAITLGAGGVESLQSWFAGLTSFSHASTEYGDIAALAGFYGPHLPYSLRTVLSLGGIAGASGLTLWWWRCLRGQQLTLASTAWLWPVWLLATPFAHLHDEIVLAIPLLAVAGGSALPRRPHLALLSVAILFLSVIPLALHPDGLQFLWLPLVVVAGCLAQYARTSAALTALAG